MAMAHFQLGLASNPGSLEHQTQLERAIELFEEIGTMHELGQAVSALDV